MIFKKNIRRFIDDSLTFGKWKWITSSL